MFCFRVDDVIIQMFRFSVYDVIFVLFIYFIGIEIFGFGILYICIVLGVDVCIIDVIVQMIIYVGFKVIVKVC